MGTRKKTVFENVHSPGLGEKETQISGCLELFPMKLWINPARYWELFLLSLLSSHLHDGRVKPTGQV
jgi:hypothetical protein